MIDYTYRDQLADKRAVAASPRAAAQPDRQPPAAFVSRNAPLMQPSAIIALQRTAGNQRVVRSLAARRQSKPVAPARHMAAEDARQSEETSQEEREAAGAARPVAAGAADDPTPGGATAPRAIRRASVQRCGGEVHPSCSCAEEQDDQQLTNHALMQRDALDDYIDLLEPKRALMAHMTDHSWITDLVEKTVDKNKANPKHHSAMKSTLYAIGMKAGAEAMAFVLRIRDCNDQDALDALEDEFNGWKAEREPNLKKELEDQVEKYREIERSWLKAFKKEVISKDPVHFNESNQNAALTLDMPDSKVIVETRAYFHFKRTDEAKKQDEPDWTDDEMQRFAERFQQQLDDVWSTKAGGVAPFRCEAPEDYLLADESPKWSEMTANMEARVTLDANQPHFQVDVFKQASDEGKRPAVSSTPGQATFYLENAHAGYMAESGPDADKQDPQKQHTLAHEWTHMIGNPDEYPEPSVKDGKARARCEQRFIDIINDPSSTYEQQRQAYDDLQAIRNYESDHTAIFALAGRPDVPDDCFTREDPPLRPGAQSGRGGTHISQSDADTPRLSDEGNIVRPYMREGIVEALQSMLRGRFDPEVSFDHNIQAMTSQEVAEIARVRIQKVLHDIKDLGTTKAQG